MSLQVFQQGQVNLASLVLPNVYVIIKPPDVQTIRGVPTNIVAAVGTAKSGPITGSSTGPRVISVGSVAEVPSLLGGIGTSKNDLGMAINVAGLNGPVDFRCVRCNTGTASATATLLDASSGSVGVFTAKYPGTFGNSIGIFVDTGAAVDSYRVTIQATGTTLKEVFDNISTATAANFKTLLAAAITNGQGALRPPSELVTFAAGNSVLLPTLTPFSTYGSYLALTGGSDGSVGDQIGSAANGDGIYAFEGSDARLLVIPGLDDVSKWSEVVAFCARNGMGAILGFAAGLSTDDAITAKNNAGLDTWKAMFVKDYIAWNDATNRIANRLVPAECFAAGLAANLSPEQGIGNKPVFGLVGTERSLANHPYTDSEASKLTTVGINFFTNPIPAGRVFGLRNDRNGSSSGEIDGWNYTRMTDFLSVSLAQGLGKFIGQVQSPHPNDPVRADAYATLNAFLTLLQLPSGAGGVGMIASFALILDETNNTKITISRGYLNAEVKVEYLSVIRYFVVTLQGGQTVVTVAANPSQSFLQAA